MDKKLTIEDAIRKALQDYSIGDTVSRIQLTKMVSYLRGIDVLGASVDRILRYMQRAGILGYNVVRRGVFEITEKNWNKDRKTPIDALNWAVNKIFRTT